ncbi:MAG: tyrosine-type recombinase/integrase, partial [Methanogenium sp.]|nr:tyrosine-type recombinase/integrase [Methanogenium sp.]
MENNYFSEWLPRFNYHLKMRNYSPKTITSYEQVIRKFAYYLWLRRNVERNEIETHWEDLQNSRMDTEMEVTPIIVNDFLAFLTSRRNYKAKTLHRIISSLSSFYRYIYIQAVIKTNPMIGIDRPRIKEQELKYLKHNQVIRLMNSIQNPRDKLIIRTIYATGIRVSELCGINTEDIDFEDHTIRIKGKGGKIRTVFMDSETLDEIDRFSA